MLDFSIPQPTAQFVDPKTGLINVQWYLFLNSLFSASSPTGVIPVTEGGTGLTSGVSGGILGFTGTTTLSSSPLLGANEIVLGGGIGATPTTPVGLGTSVTVLHGNAGGVPSFGPVALGTDVSGTLQAGQFPALTGDISTPGASLTTTLKNTGTAGTYALTTFDAQGRETSGTANLPSSNLAGTTTNDNAATGIVGEYMTSSLASGSAVSLTTATAKTITSLSLTAGDWDVYGVVDIAPNTTTVVTLLLAGISLTNNALGADDTFSGEGLGSGITGGSTSRLNAPTQRISLSTTTNVFLVGRADFSISTATAFGTIRARRMR